MAITLKGQKQVTKYINIFVILCTNDSKDNLFEDISCYKKKKYKTEEFDARFKTFQMRKPRNRVQYIQEYTICNPYHLKKDLATLNKLAISMQEDFNINPKYTTSHNAVETLIAEEEEEEEENTNQFLEKEPML